MRGMRGKGVRGRGRGVFEGLTFAGIYSAILKIPGLDVIELVRSGLGVPFRENFAGANSAVMKESAVGHVSSMRAWSLVQID